MFKEKNEAQVQHIEKMAQLAQDAGALCDCH